MRPSAAKAADLNELLTAALKRCATQERPSAIRKCGRRRSLDRGGYGSHDGPQSAHKSAPGLKPHSLCGDGRAALKGRSSTVAHAGWMFPGAGRFGLSRQPSAVSRQEKRATLSG